MGWKTLKTHFDIKHQVHMTENGLCIGSPYIHDIITINVNTGHIRINAANPSFLETQYPQLMKASPEDIVALIRQPDTFTSSIPVYTYKGGQIIEKRCETLGWPNVTHDGELMYENTHSNDRNLVIEWARKDARAGIQITQGMIQKLESDLESLRQELTQHECNLKMLEVTS